jgi:hypothetical protein
MLVNFISEDVEVVSIVSGKRERTLSVENGNEAESSAGQPPKEYERSPKASEEGTEIVQFDMRSFTNLTSVSFASNLPTKILSIVSGVLITCLNVYLVISVIFGL